MVLPNLSSTVLYENIYNNVDLEVINSTVGVKENLILKDSNTKNVFNIEYNIGDLVAESVDSHTIELKYADGAVVYTISAPYMVDSNGEESEAVELKILQNNKGKLSVKLTADKTWLKDSSRVYPVTVDPAFTYGQDWGQIKSTYVNSGAASTSYTEGSFYVGRPGDNGIRRSLIKIPNLPKLNIGDMVVNARIILWQVYNTPTIDMYVGAYESNSDWTDLSSVTWNNQPGFIDNLIDYEKCEAYTYGWRDLDITELIKKWYNGADNNGFYLTMLNESNVYQGLWFSSSLYPTDSTVRPELEITYRNNKGLENRWTYTPISAGSAGTAYINDYSGNLVFQFGVTSTSGLKLPASVGFTYNSYMADSTYRSSGIYTGFGWRMNLQQTVLVSGELANAGTVSSSYPYVYTDEDGTDHYFYKKTDSETNTTEFLDEDGLGLELEVGTDEYIITDENKTKKYFTKSTNRLARIENSTGQKVLVEYETESTHINKITDANGKSVEISYTDGYINTIKDPAQRITTMVYDTVEGYLTSVIYPDGTTVSFTYVSEGLLSSVTDIDGKKLLFDYAQGGSRGVTSVQEVAADGTLGQKITFDRTKYNTTKMQTAGVDCVFGNSDDITTIYQFDNWGRTVSVQSKNSLGEDLGASAYTYTSGEVNSTGSNIKQINRLSSNYSLGANRENLVKDHNMESLTNWTKSSWIASTVDFTATMNSESKKVLYGQKSLMIDVDSVSGDARGRVRQDISSDYLEQGATYTLSAYVRTENLVPVEGAENYGAVICITPLDEDASTTDIYAEHVSRNTDTSINKGFRRISVTFTMPQNSTFDGVRIQLALRAATGTAYFDGVQLEKSDAPSSYNMLENSSFERSDSWTGSSTTSSDGRVAETLDGDKAMKLTGNVTSEKSFYQEVAVSPNKADTYILSGWAKGNAVPLETNNSAFELFAEVKYSDNSVVEKRSAVFNTTVSDWQYGSFAFNLDNNEDDNLTPVKIIVYTASNYQGNTFYFDNIQLTKEPVPSYTYDEEGNLISVVANEKQRYNYTYEDNLLTEVIDPRNSNYKYTYEYYEKDNEKTNLLKSATTQRGAKYTYQYDDFGNATSMEAEAPSVDENSEDKLYLKSTVIYNYPEVEETTYSVESYDQDGKMVESVYDANKGTLTSVTDSKNVTTNYTYNANNDLPLTITKGGQSVSYAYDNYHKLTGITHAGTTYSFEYDEFANRTKTKVGNRTLSTNTYAPNNGYLQSMTYGNGFTQSYTYDRFGNMAEIKYGNTTVLKNFADSSGAIIRTQDLLTNYEHRVSYDSTGRLISKELLDLSVTGNADKWLHSLEYNFDANNNVTHFAFADKNRSFVTAYEYGKDNLLEKTTLPSGKEVGYTYDNLGRLTGKNLNTSNAVNATYTYHESLRADEVVDGVTKNYTTLKIASEETPAFGYKYSYDELGNISAVYEGVKGTNGNYSYSNTPTVSYVYDANGQLTHVNDFVNNEQYEYVYNSAGNITRRYHYSMNSDWQPASTLESIRYTYADTNGWKDLMTKYNGQTITYDAIGNPLSYRDGISLTWQNGRELASFTNADTSVSYTYDASGMRTSKTLTSDGATDTVKYVYENGLLLQMQYNHMYFDFIYDANGNPVSMAYRMSPTAVPSYYYYGTNWRGDVVALYNSNGNLIARYTYDAYGKSLSVTTPAGASIPAKYAVPNLNPLRYRGYVYDTETGFYYLQSRYYDPTTCRFVNADGYCATGQGITGNNAFVYCGNNSVMYSDDSGKRYCAAANSDKETSYEIEVACKWQKNVVNAKYNPEPIDTYSDGNIYLVEDTNEIFALFPGDVIAIDKRSHNKYLEKNIEIWRSYLITDQSHQAEIILCLLEYEKNNPANWNRTFDSMMVEWDAHNDSYYLFNLTPFNVPFERAKHVAFDNRDEGKSYWDHTFGRVLGGQ